MDLQAILPNFEIEPNVCITPQRSIFLLAAPQVNIKVLKQLKTGAARAYLTGKLLEVLKESSLVPELVKTKTDRYYLWNNGNRYMITSYLAGREADYFQLTDLQAAIRAMRLFHHQTRGLVNLFAKQAAVCFDPGRQWVNCFHEMETCRELAIKVKTDWSKRYLEFWHLHADMACRAIMDWQSLKINRNSYTVCYHDWAFHNVIINSKGHPYLIDFDYMVVDYPIHDRVNLIRRYLRLYQWSDQALFRVLWQFDQHYPWQKQELKMLRIYLAFPYDFWILGRQYFIEKQPWSRTYYQDQWERKVELFEQKIKLLELIRAIE